MELDITRRTLKLELLLLCLAAGVFYLRLYYNNQCIILTRAGPLVSFFFDTFTFASSSDGSAVLCLRPLFSSSTLRNPKMKKRLWKTNSASNSLLLIVSVGVISDLKIAAPRAISLDFIWSQRERWACRSDTLIWLTGNESLWSRAATGHRRLYPPIRCQNKTTFFNNNSTNWKARSLWSILFLQRVQHERRVEGSIM